MDGARLADPVGTNEAPVEQPVIDPGWASWYGRRDLRRFRRVITRCVGPALALASAALAGCGPVEYISQVSNRAAAAVSAAKLAQADRYAPYEYTAAEEYLHKAREEGGYSQYEDAIEYGHRAEDLANRARAISLQRLAEQPTASTRATPGTEHEEPRSAAPPPEPPKGPAAP